MGFGFVFFDCDIYEELMESEVVWGRFFLFELEGGYIGGVMVGMFFFVGNLGVSLL